MTDEQEPDVEPLAEDPPVTSHHTFTNAVGAVAAMDVPDGYAPPDVIMMTKDGATTPAVFTHDEFVPQAYVAPPTTDPPPTTTTP